MFLEELKTAATDHILGNHFRSYSNLIYSKYNVGLLANQVRGALSEFVGTELRILKTFLPSSGMRGVISIFNTNSRI